jgi:choline kinase
MSKTCQAIILNAGQGKRLRPLTDTTHKSLIQIGSMSILQHQINSLKAAGVNRIVMVLGYRADEMIAEAKKITDIDWVFIINDAYATTENICSFYMVEKELVNNSFVMMGDILCDSSIFTSLKNQLTKMNIAVRERQSYTPDDMKVSIHNGILQTISKQIKKPDAEYLQISYFDKSMLDHAREAIAYLKSANEKAAWYPAILQHVVKAGIAVHPINVEGEWIEIDNIDDLNKAKKQVSVSS